jgi:AAT family amino acid transporter
VLTWGPAIRGTRLINAPDWRWLHVGEMAVFFLCLPFSSRSTAQLARRFSLRSMC